MEEFLGALFKGDWDAVALNEKLGSASAAASSASAASVAAAPEPEPMAVEPELAKGTKDEGPSLRTGSVKKGDLWKECGMEECVDGRTYGRVHVNIDLSDVHLCSPMFNYGQACSSNVIYVQLCPEAFFKFGPLTSSVVH